MTDDLDLVKLRELVEKATPGENLCPELRKNGGCTLHNLHCRYPECNRKPGEKEAQDELRRMAPTLARTVLGPQRQQLFLAVAAVFQAPELRGRRDQQVEAVCVSALVRPSLGLQAPDRRIGQQDTPAGVGVRTPRQGGFAWSEWDGMRQVITAGLRSFQGPWDDMGQPG